MGSKNVRLIKLAPTNYSFPSITNKFAPQILYFVDTILLFVFPTYLITINLKTWHHIWFMRTKSLTHKGSLLLLHGLL